jgi:soluble lytic murein transglycosylase-like protein
MTRRTTATLALLAAALMFAPAARADYAVLRSGVRLHVTGIERDGDRVRLNISGGSIEIAADDLASVEPEDVFLPAPAVAAPDAPFEKLIREAAARNGMDEKLIAHVIAAESNFDPKAVSRKQALGLMQLLPSTAARYSVGNAFDPAQNIEAGTHYLKDLLAKYRGNLTLALAAYNAGPDVVDHYGGVPPFPETVNYVRKITAKLAADAQAPTHN